MGLRTLLPYDSHLLCMSYRDRCWLRTRWPQDTRWRDGAPIRARMPHATLDLLHVSAALGTGLSVGLRVSERVRERVVEGVVGVVPPRTPLTHSIQQLTGHYMHARSRAALARSVNNSAWSGSREWW